MISYKPPNVITTHCLSPDPTSAVSLSGPSSILAGDVATFTCVSHNVSGHSTFRSVMIFQTCSHKPNEIY